MVGVDTLNPGQHRLCAHAGFKNLMWKAPLICQHPLVARPHTGQSAGVDAQVGTAGLRHFRLHTFASQARAHLLRPLTDMAGQLFACLQRQQVGAVSARLRRQGNIGTGGKKRLATALRSEGEMYAHHHRGRGMAQQMVFTQPDLQFLVRLCRADFSRHRGNANDSAPRQVLLTRTR